MQSLIYPCLWFEGEAEAAARYYCSIFPSSSIQSSDPIVTLFNVNGNKFMALNGRNDGNFSNAISFVVNCDTQEEIDHLWNALSEEGEEQMCGWVKDRYGVSWQIVPSILGSLMADPERAPHVVNAFLKMRKFVIQELLDAGK